MTQTLTQTALTQTLDLLFLAMPYTDDQGDEHPDAIWYLQQIDMDNSLFGGGGAGARWYGYKDALHLAAKAAPIGIIPDQVETQEYFAAIQQPVTPGASHAADTAQAFALLALSHKTVPVLNPDKTPVLDAAGKPVLKSPFDGATIVVLPVTITLPDTPTP